VTDKCLETDLKIARQCLKHIQDVDAQEYPEGTRNSCSVVYATCIIRWWFHCSNGRSR